MNKVYLVYANSDTTEGRGPMILIAVFSKLEPAIDYASSRGGIMGRKMPMTHEVHSDEWSVNDHDIKEMVVHDSVKSLKMQVRQYLQRAALRKLTREEREALGLGES